VIGMTLRFNLLDDRLLRYRDVDNHPHDASLPELLSALGRDTVRDFPALRPHQRHPWHAFLVYLAAIALHRAERKEPFDTADAWRRALLALTPDDEDGAAFSLVAPDDRPAFLQAPCKGGESRTWKKRLLTPDAVDMLLTSKNHDMKAARMVHANPEDWVFALVSLQTQEGFLGAGNYGISRMNGGFASRPAFGVVPAGHVGKRWARDTRLLLEQRAPIVKRHEFKDEGGLAFVWLRPWDGASSLSLKELDPFYIEICRRVRLTVDDTRLFALATSSKTARIAAKERNGVTGDAWTPVHMAEAKALSITSRGFDYRLASTLAFSDDFERTIASKVCEDDGKEGLFLLAQGITRGQGKTEGYHERRIPVSRRIREAFRIGHTDEIAKRAKDRIAAIADVRKVLWIALCNLLGNGDPSVSDETKRKASEFARRFESEEDVRFFDDLIVEVESDSQEEVHDRWLAEMFDRAERVLELAFIAGPRSAERRYRARGAALSCFHSYMRLPKYVSERIVRVLKQRDDAHRQARREHQEEVAHDID
jgi:CRISPR system Cascade subunit CasA